MFKPVLAAATLLVTAAAAQAPPKHLTYSGYAHGFNVVDLTASLAVAPKAYRIEVGYSLVGVLGAVLHGDGKTVVNGRFEGLRAEPNDLFSTGHFRGDPRVTQMVWRGGTPVTLQLVPPVADERDPVPSADQADTIDTLSAMVALIHQVEQTGKCEGSDRTFDGRRLSQIAARTAGEEELEPTGRSMFHGKALRCNFEGRQLAGFRHDTDPEEQRREQTGAAWFARLVPGDLPVPVRIVFNTPQFGDTTMYLTGAK